MKPKTTKVKVVAVIRSASGAVHEFAGEVRVHDIDGYVKRSDMDAAILSKCERGSVVEKLKEVSA